MKLSAWLIVVSLVVVVMQSLRRRRRRYVVRMSRVAHPAMFLEGASVRAVLHYSRRTVALASAPHPAARRSRKYGARRGADGPRTPVRCARPSRLRLVRAHALSGSEPARSRTVSRRRARAPRNRRGATSDRRARAPATSG